MQTNFIIPDSTKVEIPPELVGKAWLLPDKCDDQWLLADKLAEPTSTLLLCKQLADLLCLLNFLPACFCLAFPVPLLFALCCDANFHCPSAFEFLTRGAAVLLWAAASYLYLKTIYEWYRNRFVRRNLAKLRKRSWIRRLVGLVFREGTRMQFDGLDDSFRSNFNRMFLVLLDNLFFAGVLCLLTR